MEPVNPYAPPDTEHSIAPAWQTAPIVDSWHRFVAGDDLIATTFSTHRPAHAHAVRKLAAMPIWFWAVFGGGTIAFGCLTAWTWLRGEDIAFIFLVGAASCAWITLRTLWQRRRVMSVFRDTLAKLPSTIQCCYEDHLEFINPFGRTMLRWDGLRRVRWLDGVLTLQVGAVAWFMFPDGLEAPRGTESLIELLRRKLPGSRHERTLQALAKFFAAEPPLRTDQQVIRDVLQRQWRRVPILPLERIELGSQVLAPALGTEHWTTRRPDMPPKSSLGKSFVERFLTLFGLGLLIGLPLVILASVVAIEFDLNAHWGALLVLILIVVMLPLMFSRMHRGRHAKPEGVMIGGGVTLFSDEGIYQITIDAVIFTLWGAIVGCHQTASRMELSTQYGLPIPLEQADYSREDWQRLVTFVPERIATASRLANDPPSTADEISLVPQPTPTADRSRRDETDDSGKSARSP
ncbi:MAG: hypothetical protein JNM18_09955 [Planctomycetaceae bacterium]|nr:hypothetical protein [Planctomycetaceae bacterium]